MKKIIIYITAIVLIEQGCSQRDSELDKAKEVDNVQEGGIVKKPEPKFYSMSNPGKWEEQVLDHPPSYEVVTEKDIKKIKIKVPLKVERSHYIETILLLDHNRKELQKKIFKRGEKPEVEFELPADYRAFVYIVLKCNLHDMWQTKVLFD